MQESDQKFPSVTKTLGICNGTPMGSPLLAMSRAQQVTGKTHPHSDRAIPPMSFEFAMKCRMAQWPHWVASVGGLASSGCPMPRLAGCLRWLYGTGGSTKEDSQPEGQTRVLARSFKLLRWLVSSATGNLRCCLPPLTRCYWRDLHQKPMKVYSSCNGTIS